MSLFPSQSSVTSVLGKPLKAAALLDFNRRILLEVLTAAGTGRAVVNYSGEGDEGRIEGVDIEPSDVDLQVQIAMLHEIRSYDAQKGWQVHQDFESKSIEEALLDYADGVIEQYHGGYENNDGGRGEVIFDCKEARVALEHYDFYVESTMTVTEL